MDEHLCDYGCGQNATIQFENGKYCCSSWHSKCPAVKHKVGSSVSSSKGQYKVKINKIDIYMKEPKTCLNCGSILPYEKRRNIFCGSVCSGIYNNYHCIKLKECRKGPLRSKYTGTRLENCLFCGKKIGGKFTKFCSFSCKMNYEDEKNIRDWLDGKLSGSCKTRKKSFIRRYLIKKYGERCTICGWNELNVSTGKIPIQIHHIDGNRTNNSESNLTLLCPNCHSLTDSFAIGKRMTYIIND